MAAPASAQERAQEVEEGVVAVDGDSASGDFAPPTIDTGDHAWMLISTALVLLMTAPGLAMFYSGLVRKKNVLGVMMQCLSMMAIMTVIWALYGYSLSFGGSPGEESYSPWIGNFDYVFMGAHQGQGKEALGVQPYWNESRREVIYPVEGTIPRLTHMLFQGMFFIITPALICGAFAERMKYSTMVVFSILWGTLVYCPLCHWVWDYGMLSFDNEEAWFKSLDFAGGTVVHISSGVSALVCALVLGRRLGFGHDPMPPHNLTYTTLGAALLWVGWFGFNAGSALNAGALAATAFTATHFAAAAGGIGWAAAEWVLRGKPTVLGTCSGAVAGLVCITPASGYVQPMSALVMGLLAGLVCFFACTTLKSKFRYDDSLDAFGVHGVGGTLGALLTGLFATRAIKGGETQLGLLEHGDLLTGQLGATAVTWAYAAVATFVLLKILDVTMGLRVTQQQEIQGLDLSQHGEEGYIFI
ncbi:MAG: ammonium transporter [Planctomycetaceae bacterium]|nr:ammonium transporter [Planctomycetaceae bacterium]